MTFVFVGAYSEVLGAGIRLTRFGERVELPDQIAESVGHPRGLPCIPAADFDGINFTADELRKYGAAATHPNASAEFLAKKARALQILATLRGALRETEPEEK